MFYLLAFCGVGLFFANLFYKIAKESAPDAKRRLKLLAWGANASLSPMFLAVVYTRVRGTDLNSLPGALVLVLMVLMFGFPATMAYVIVVERALDVRVVVRQGLQYALAQRAVRVMTALLILGVLVLAAQIINDPAARRAQRLQALAWSIFLVIVLRRGATKGRAWVDRRFFREQVEAEQVLAELGQEVRKIGDAAELKALVCGRVASALHVERVEITPDGPGEGWELALPLSAGDAVLGHLVLGPKKGEAPYSRADRRLLEAVAAQTALALDNARLTSRVAEEAAQRERMHRELEIAREVQQQLLPQRPPPVDGFELAGRCRPAQSVGGDYFDFFRTPDGLLTAVLGDVCGKGVPAALLMAGVQASLRGLCAGGVNDLGELMSRLNRLVWEATPKNRFVTLWCGQWDAAAGVLRYASAGHGDALLVRAGGAMEVLGARGLALGLVGHADYGSGEVRLLPGDLVAVSTDGVAEARSPAGEEFGDQRWVECVRNAAGLGPGQLIEHVMQSVDSFAGGAEQHDDITIVALRASAPAARGSASSAGPETSIPA
jgi:sigma-B regulation protein RsbU (phosphoserine phosphatase)